MNGKNRRIQVLLISSDSLLVQQIHSLSEGDFEIHHEMRITHAGALMQQMAPQVVLIDAEINRELAAMEFCYFIKSNPNFAHCKTFILSGHAEEFAEVAAFDAG